jgi:hypothetical protein
LMSSAGGSISSSLVVVASMSWLVVEVSDADGLQPIEHSWNSIHCNQHQPWMSNSIFLVWLSNACALSVIPQAGDISKTLSLFFQLFQFADFVHEISNPRASRCTIAVTRAANLGQKHWPDQWANFRYLMSWVRQLINVLKFRHNQSGSQFWDAKFRPKLFHQWLSPNRISEKGFRSDEVGTCHKFHSVGVWSLSVTVSRDYDWLTLLDFDIRITST